MHKDKRREHALEKDMERQAGETQANDANGWVFLRILAIIINVKAPIPLAENSPLCLVHGEHL